MKTIDSVSYTVNCVTCIIIARINANNSDVNLLSREFGDEGYTDEASYETPLRIKAKFQETEDGEITVSDIEVNEYLNGAIWEIDNFIYQYEY